MIQTLKNQKPDYGSMGGFNQPFIKKLTNEVITKLWRLHYRASALRSRSSTCLPSRQIIFRIESALFDP